MTYLWESFILIFLGCAQSFSIRENSGIRLLSKSIRKNHVAFGGGIKVVRARTQLCSVPDDIDYYKGMDAYQILGVARTATASEIKDAYRALVAKWHPDKHSGSDKNESELRAASINRAYYCIGDAERRRNYDMYGDEGVGASAASGMRTGSEFDISELFGGAASPFGGDISDLFGSIFGGSRMEREVKTNSKGSISSLTLL